MADARELILLRLVEIAEGISGIATVLRNARSISDLDLPAICIMDADETAYPADEPTTGQPPTRFTRMTMTPEVVIKLSELSETVGSDLNAIRALIVEAVMTDTELRTLCTNAGHLRYLGCATQLAYGRAMLGEMAVAFAFTYNLRPGDL